MEVYTNLTVKHVVGLAAPHTWPASVFPVLLGSALVVALDGGFSWLVFPLVLIGAILLQSSVNTINDYYDFVKGNDTVENSDDPNDAILVYNNLKPRQVRSLGFGFMLAAGLLGIYPVYRGGLITLGIGVVGCLVIIAYSAGRSPISHLPLGELVSGTVMGWGITVAVFSAFTGYADPNLLFLSLPLVFGIGLIMMTNNACDIERDTTINRRTLPVLLGRSRTKHVYIACVVCWIILVIACTAGYFPGGLLLVCLLLLAAFPIWLRLVRLPLNHEQRKQCMGTIVMANIWVHSAYVAAILMHAFNN